MIQVSIIGSGNVAQHLIQAFAKTTEIELVQVFSRKKETVNHLIISDKIITNLNLEND
jgi:ornithine cyclodeaminase/alanine dehydrogenase-like protein (mu-crystallin family)